MSDTGLEESVIEWVASAPREIRNALQSVVVMNELRRFRNVCFQIPGANDGSISEECSKSFKTHYRAMTAFVCALENTTPPVGEYVA